MVLTPTFLLLSISCSVWCVFVFGSSVLWLVCPPLSPDYSNHDRTKPNYSFIFPPPSASGITSTNIIVGAIAGSILFLGLILAVTAWCYKWVHRMNKCSWFNGRAFKTQVGEGKFKEFSVPYRSYKKRRYVESEVHRRFCRFVFFLFCMFSFCISSCPDLLLTVVFHISPICKIIVFNFYVQVSFCLNWR